MNMAVREFLFQEVCQHLAPKDVRSLAYSQDLSGKYLYTNDGIEVLLKLEMEGRFSKHNLSPLAEMMKVIGRKDLAKKICKYAKKQRKPKDSPGFEECQIDLAASLKIVTTRTKIALEGVQDRAREFGDKKMEDSIAKVIAIMEQQFKQRLFRLGSSGSSDEDTSASRHSSSSSSDDGQETKSPLLQPQLQFETMNRDTVGKLAMQLSNRGIARNPEEGCCCTI